MAANRYGLPVAHRTTAFRHPWTNGQVEITNKMLKEATVKHFHYEHPDELKRHLMVFLLYYNHQRPLRSLKYKTPWQALEDCYHLKPEWFHENLFQKIVGLNKGMAGLSCEMLVLFALILP